MSPACGKSSFDHVFNPLEKVVPTLVANTTERFHLCQPGLQRTWHDFGRTGGAPIHFVLRSASITQAWFSSQKPYICKIPGCTKRYTDPSSLRKHVKTVHGPDAHVTKKQRNDVHVRAPLLKENGDEASTEPGGRGSEDNAEASSTNQAMEDCLHIKAIKTESSGVSRAGQPSWQRQLHSSAQGPESLSQLWALLKGPLSKGKITSLPLQLSFQFFSLYHLGLSCSLSNSTPAGQLWQG
jgi:hypothetical protein